MPFAYVDALAVSGTNLFAGINGGGLFLSTDSGSTWIDVDGPGYVYALAISGGNLFAAAWTGAVWRRPLSDMITSVELESVWMPREFLLQQNYPNPFNPSTTIRYLVPMQSRVTLKVFDVLGRELTTLVNGIEEPGEKSVQFDGSNISSGMYFYELQAGEFVQARKFLLLR